MSKLRAFIIDDEVPARELIKVFLQERGEIEVIGEAENGFEGAKQINAMHPDLVFLDIQMPKIDGFEMLELVEYQPKIIFCTAYDQYAIKAFDKKAIDYLLKPFSRARFNEAIAKVLVAPPTDIPNALDLDVADYSSPINRVIIKERKEIIILNTDDISYLEAQDDYVAVISVKGKWLKQKTMNYFEKVLDSSKFVRIHRKYLVNISEISKLDKMGKESYLLVLKSGKSLPVSLTGYQKLKDQLQF